MSAQQIFELALQYGAEQPGITFDSEALLRYTRKVQEMEREACAKVCEEFYSIEGIAQNCAAAIRARKAALAEPENWELRRLSEELERCKQVCAATSEAWREEAALAEPVQQGCDHCNHPLYAAIKCRVCGRKTPIIEPEIKKDNKPVAWMMVNPKHPRLSKSLHWTPQTDWHITWESVPLYTVPTQRKPLTEEEALDIARTFGAQPWPPGSCVAFARAVEKAHGIGDKDVHR